ncbi:lipocalin family protein [Lentiprolixibacter aurantiacus]|uniref:Lipocalin-like domain-containing protein n=1 Tax=Lentiprolixibacter aurantiacus TaxID=2993939 RepID=A0AAE3SPB0_9FLAO|nr:lipocalin family protein [Lentiprolixibacter aurantiacus]MCX2720420.1 hypothetical protein [Lentiprolixibacter aurantiacus]
MKVWYCVFTVCLLLGCGSRVDPGALPQLNGYWEIEKVVFPDGSNKTYEVNTSIDFIEIKGQQGFRKKMQPQFDGTFNTSDDAEQFTVISVKNRLIMRYSNADNHWEETLVEITTDHFQVLSEDGVTYHYKRYEPLEMN